MSAEPRALRSALSWPTPRVLLQEVSYRTVKEPNQPAFAGSQLGRVRDAKGKPVAQVFAGLPMSQKTQVGVDRRVFVPPIH